MSPQARREQLVGTVLELYATAPPDQVGVDDVARAADVSRALFYRYFSGIDELRVAALGAVAHELVERVALPVSGGLREQLHAAVAEFLTVAQRYRGAYIALLRSGSAISTGETDALVDGVRDHIVGLLAQRTAAGAPSPLTTLTLRSWVAVVEAVTLSWLCEPRPMIPREHLEVWLVDQFVAMTAVTTGHEAHD